MDWRHCRCLPPPEKKVNSTTQLFRGSLSSLFLSSAALSLFIQSLFINLFSEEGILTPLSRLSQTLQDSTRIYRFRRVQFALLFGLTCELFRGYAALLHWTCKDTFYEVHHRLCIFGNSKRVCWGCERLFTCRWFACFPKTRHLQAQYRVGYLKINLLCVWWMCLWDENERSNEIREKP